MIKRLIEHYRYMREHRWTHARYSAYLDGELSDRERSRVEEHAGICPQCRHVLASLKKTLQGLRGLSGESRESRVADAVIERLRGEG